MVRRQARRLATRLIAGRRAHEPSANPEFIKVKTRLALKKGASVRTKEEKFYFFSEVALTLASLSLDRESVQNTGTKPDYLSVGFNKIEDDLRFLMDCFAEVLKDLGLGDMADFLPWRGKLPPADLVPAKVGQVYSIAFQLLNMVEELAASDMRTLREKSEGLTAEHGSWGQQIARLKETGFSPEQIAETLALVRVEPVLTAHPTEAKRLAVLEQHRVLYGLIASRAKLDLTPSQAASLQERTSATLERLWRTGEILLEKPTVSDELRNSMHYLRDVFPSVLPKLDERLYFAWTTAGFDPALLRGKLPQIRFGTWVGGDRDGHPLVTPEVTADSRRQQQHRLPFRPI